MKTIYTLAAMMIMMSISTFNMNAENMTLKTGLENICKKYAMNTINNKEVSKIENTSSIQPVIKINIYDFIQINNNATVNSPDIELTAMR